MVFNVTRTIYGINLQTALLLDQPFRPLPNTTLNEKFDILPNYGISDMLPKLRLMTIGIGGNPVIENTAINGKRGSHRPVDGALFKHIPFILRPENNDLSENERKRYRLRKTVYTDSGAYIAYYGRLIDDIKFTNTLFQVTSVEGDNFIGPYDTLSDSNILNPVPTLNTDIFSTKGRYILNMCKVYFHFTQDEINEIKNAIKILYPNDNTNTITEIGFCSSLDVDTTYGKESVWTQINYFVDTNFDLELLYNLANEKEIEYQVEIGGMEPLYMGA